MRPTLDEPPEPPVFGFTKTMIGAPAWDVVGASFALADDPTAGPLVVE